MPARLRAVYSACLMALHGLHHKIKATNRRMPQFDFTMNMCLVPTKSKILALLYTERNEFTKVWERTQGVHRYCYWDNTDKPNNVNQKAWDARGKEWDKALGEKCIPASVGFTWDPVAGHLPFPNKKDIVKSIPSIEKRAKVIAETLFETEWNKSQTAESKDVYEMWDKFREWKNSEDGVKRFTELDSDVRTKLFPITEKMLSESYKDVKYLKV